MAFDYNGGAETDRALDRLDFEQDRAQKRWEALRMECMTCADDISDVLHEVRELLAEGIANDDPQAIGEVVLAAMGAYGSRIATRSLGGSTWEADRLPTEIQAAAKAMATLTLRRAS